MGLFAARARRLVGGTATVAGRQATSGVPARFAAVGEALVAGARPAAGPDGLPVLADGLREACAVLGADLAGDGIPLTDALEDLRLTYDLVRGTAPDYGAVHALSVAWSDATLTYLHQLSCADPATGLASLGHLRAVLGGVYRAHPREGAVAERHALVVVDIVEVSDPAGALLGEGRSGSTPWTRALLLARLGDAARSVFAGSEEIARAGQHRVVVLAGRDDRLGRRTALVRTLAESAVERDQQVRVWIEGLPGTELAAAQLLDELARL